MWLWPCYRALTPDIKCYYLFSKITCPQFLLTSRITTGQQFIIHFTNASDSVLKIRREADMATYPKYSPSKDQGSSKNKYAVLRNKWPLQNFQVLLFVQRHKCNSHQCPPFVAASLIQALQQYL